MRNRLLITLALSMFTLAAFAQSGGIKGRIVSRVGREPIVGVSVSTNPESKSTTTDANGYFQMEGISAGTYMVRFEDSDYQKLDVAVYVEDAVKDIYTFVMIPTAPQTTLDDSIFAEFDSESGSDATSAPSSLSGSRDLFSNVASYQFSEIRFNPRGYRSEYSDVFLNGIRMNDALTGYSPWSLWSGLNEATRNQEGSAGLESFEYGLGGLNNSTNILARASFVRQGYNVSVVGANSMYRGRVMATYGSGLKDNGWAYAFSVSTRQGGNDFTEGTYYNTFAYFASIEKHFNDQSLAFTLLGTPSERGIAQASTQEVYDLVGSNFYNPNWGYQNGEERNNRVKRYHEPVAMLNYEWEIDDRSTLSVASSFRFGDNGYSSLTWYAGTDPRPDYYYKLPSYDGASDPALLADQWKNNTGNIQHMDWDAMYNINYNGRQDETYGDGRRAMYMVEERHTDQRDWNLATNFSHYFEDNSNITAGLNVRRNRTEYYSSVLDLMGADYWVDVDKFAERDFGQDELAYQNNLDYYEEHGHAQAAKEGDKYNYDYYAHVLNGNAWANYQCVVPGVPALDIKLGGEVGYASMWREGLWRKGLFADNSKGNSELNEFLTYNAKLHAGYRIDGANSISLNVAAMQEAPTFATSFISPRTRNDITPGIDTEKIKSADLTYNVKYGDFKLRLSGYYTTIKDQMDVISFYNDLYSSFDNLAISGIDKQYMGIEGAVSVPLYGGLSLNSAVSLGNHTYTSNAQYIEMVDNSQKILSEGTVYWKDFAVEESPQTAANVGLAYRGANYLFINVDFNYYDRNYLSMNPLYRTDNVLTGLNAEQVKQMRAQERFDPAYVLNASIGKSWSFDRKYYLGMNLGLKNLLNNQNIRMGGYEQLRLNEIDTDGVSHYEKFDSKYFYMLGTTYYLNVYLRF